MTELPEVELLHLERMYADELYDAVEAGLPFVITRDGEKTAVVVPYRTMTMLVNALTPLFKATVQGVSKILGVKL